MKRKGSKKVTNSHIGKHAGFYEGIPTSEFDELFTCEVVRPHPSKKNHTIRERCKPIHQSTVDATEKDPRFIHVDDAPHIVCNGSCNSGGGNECSFNCGYWFNTFCGDASCTNQQMRQYRSCNDFAIDFGCATMRCTPHEDCLTNTLDYFGCLDSEDCAYPGGPGSDWSCPDGYYCEHLSSYCLGHDMGCGCNHLGPIPMLYCAYCGGYQYCEADTDCVDDCSGNDSGDPCGDPGACNYSGLPPAAMYCTQDNQWYDYPLDCANACGGMPPAGNGFDNCIQISNDSCEYPHNCDCGTGTCPNGYSEHALSIMHYTYSCDELLCDACNQPDSSGPGGSCGYNEACENTLTGSDKSVCYWSSSDDCQSVDECGICGGDGSSCDDSGQTIIYGCFLPEFMVCNPQECPSGSTCENDLEQCVYKQYCINDGSISYCPGDGTRCPCKNANVVLEEFLGNVYGPLRNDFIDTTSCANVNECGTGTNGYCNSEGGCDLDCYPKWKDDWRVDQWLDVNNSCNFGSSPVLGDCLSHAHTARNYCGWGCKPESESGADEYLDTCKAYMYNLPGLYVCYGTDPNGDECFDDGSFEGGAYDQNPYEGCWSNYFEGQGATIRELVFDITPEDGCVWNGAYEWYYEWGCSRDDSPFWNFNPNPSVQSQRYHGHCYNEGGIDNMPYCSDNFLRQCASGGCGDNNNYVYFNDAYEDGTITNYCSCDPCNTFAWVSYETWGSAHWCLDVADFAANDATGCESAHPCVLDAFTQCVQEFGCDGSQNPGPEVYCDQVCYDCDWTNGWCYGDSTYCEENLNRMNCEGDPLYDCYWEENPFPEYYDTAGFCTDCWFPCNFCDDSGCNPPCDAESQCSGECDWSLVQDCGTFLGYDPNDDPIRFKKWKDEKMMEYKRNQALNNHTKKIVDKPKNPRNTYESGRNRASIKKFRRKNNRNK